MRLGRSTDGDLGRAMALLINNQAAFVAQMREMDRQREELRKELVERVARIEAILLRLVEVLPEAVRDRIGIKPASP